MQKNANGQVHFFPFFSTFLTFLFFTHLFCFRFFSVWSFVLFSFFSSFNIIRINYWGEHKTRIQNYILLHHITSYYILLQSITSTIHCTITLLELLDSAIGKPSVASAALESFVVLGLGKTRSSFRVPAGELILSPSLCSKVKPRHPKLDFWRYLRHGISMRLPCWNVRIFFTKHI